VIVTKICHKASEFENDDVSSLDPPLPPSTMSDLDADLYGGMCESIRHLSLLTATADLYDNEATEVPQVDEAPQEVAEDESKAKISTPAVAMTDASSTMPITSSIPTYESNITSSIPVTQSIPTYEEPIQTSYRDNFANRSNGPPMHERGIRPSEMKEEG
jgi:hypothetical protein